MVVDDDDNGCGLSAEAVTTCETFEGTVDVIFADVDVNVDVIGSADGTNDIDVVRRGNCGSDFLGDVVADDDDYLSKKNENHIHCIF